MVESNCKLFDCFLVDFFQNLFIINHDFIFYMVFELTEEEYEVFSEIQIIVLFRKAEGASYEQILKEVPQISSPKTLTSLFRWSLFGRRFELQKTTGRPPSIGDVQLEIFKKKVEERCDANNSITIFEAVTILEQIQGDYMWKNYNLAKSIGLHKLACELLDFEKIELSRSWLTQFLNRHNILLKTPETLEEDRNKFCHSQILINFYSNFIANIPQNGHIIFNADETSSTFNDKGKVIVVKGKRSVKYTEKINYHFTTFACFNASGSKILKPFIILPSLKKFPSDLEFFKNHAFFTSSSSGWITKDLFTAFAIYFCNEISLFRIEHKISEDIWLILDGHRSRINSIAIEYFSKNRINVLILPSHTSHVCQPFDVGLASPMKRRIKDFAQSPPPIIQNLISKFQTNAAKQRILIISAIINAWWQTAIPVNCQTSFAATGIYPFDIQKVLSNRFVRPTNQNDSYPNEKGISINAQIITRDGKRLEIASDFYHITLENTAMIPQYHYKTIEEYLTTGCDVIFQEFPQIYIETSPGYIFHQ